MARHSSYPKETMTEEREDEWGRGKEVTRSCELDFIVNIIGFVVIVTFVACF